MGSPPDVPAQDGYRDDDGNRGDGEDDEADQETEQAVDMILYGKLSFFERLG